MSVKTYGQARQAAREALSGGQARVGWGGKIYAPKDSLDLSADGRKEP